jgi:hypothetical protein
MRLPDDSRARLWAFIFFIAAVFVAGAYIQSSWFKQELATVLAVTVATVVSARLSRITARTGVFSKIANAVAESMEDVSAWCRSNPLRFGIGKGVALVFLKTIVLFLFGVFYSPLLVAAVVLFAGAAWMLIGKLPSFGASRRVDADDRVVEAVEPADV